MRKYDKEALQAQLDKEKEILKRLELAYKDALERVNEKIKLLMMDETQSKIYQRQYQENLKKQLEEILNRLKDEEFDSIQEYLDKCYQSGFLGALYSMQQQGVPLMIPMDQKAVLKAVVTDSKISEGLYKALGVDTNRLKKVISGEISRGIAAGMTYSDIARNVHNSANTGFNNAMRIVRTEGYRIQQASSYDAQKAAKARGADIVREWNSTLDGKTRPHHVKLHGQVRGIDEPFEIYGKRAMYPGEFGDPSEDCNCRCVSLTVSKWDLREDETAWLGRTENMTDEQLAPIAAKLHISVSELRKYGNQIIPVKAESYRDFVRQYNKIWNYETSDLKREVDARKAAKK